CRPTCAGRGPWSYATNTAAARAVSSFTGCPASCSSAVRLCGTGSRRWGWAMSDRDVIGLFFRTYRASGVGETPPQPVLPGLADGEATDGAETVELSVEVPA